MPLIPQLGGLLWFCVLVALLPLSAAAADFRFSAFATAGYAVTDEDFAYLRHIDSSGTFKVDSLAGVQAEILFDPKWSATLQLVGSAARDRDDGAEAKVRWAFVSYRPANDWLFRAGRLRPPFFINSQNAEVGVTYDQARLPAEVYSLSPIYDGDGAAVTKTWLTGDAEIALDAYWLDADVKFRLPFDPSIGSAPYVSESIQAFGAILSRTTESLLVRGGLHRATLKLKDGFTTFGKVSPTLIPFPPPVGGTLYLPETPLTEFDVTVVTLGMDWREGNWRVTAEYGQRIVDDSDILGISSKSAYVTAARRAGKWTPYLTYARLLTDGGPRTSYQTLSQTPVPLAVQGPPAFVPATFHSDFNKLNPTYDQYSVMLGTSYSFSATSKLKFELMRTKVGLVSSLVDGDVHHKGFNVFSASYSIAF